MKLIKNKSFDCVMKEQKRAAAWNGFIENWALGFCKNEDLISTKKKSFQHNSTVKRCAESAAS